MESHKTLKSLNFFLKIFALHNISYKEIFFENSWPYFRVFITIISFGALSSYNLYLHYTSPHFALASPSVLISDTALTVLGYFEYIADLCFVYNFSHEMCDYFNIYDQMDKAIPMEYYNEIRHSVKAMLGFFISSWLVASLGEYAVWANVLGWISPSSYVTTYFMFLIRLLTVIDINAQTLHVKYRLKTMTDKIQDYALFADDSSSCLKTWHKRRNVNVIELNEAPTVLKFRNGIEKVNSYYLLLHEQTSFLNNYFGIRVRFTFQLYK